jgi:outer membrane protein OmpA-like peptidoglycan-associated protein
MTRHLPKRSKLLISFRWLLLSAGLSAAAALSGCVTPAGLTAAQITVLQQEGFSPVADSSWQLGLSDKILFSSDSDQLQRETATRIEGIGRTLIAVEITKLHIEGHTDDYGTDDYNNQLSHRRAQVVADELEGVGFVPSDIVVRGLGKQDPVADDSTAQGQAQNRRVSIIVPADQ